MRVFNIPRGKGFTVMEVLIAITILSLLFLAIFKIFRGVSTSVKQTSWSLNAQQQARNGLNYVREEMQRASYKTVVEIGETVETKTNFEMLLTRGKMPGNANREIAKWKICSPIRNIGQKSPGMIVEATLNLKNNSLLYTKVLLDGDAGKERLFQDKVLASDINTLELDFEDHSNSSTSDSKRVMNLVSIKLELHHPDKISFPNTIVKSKTGAKVEVEVVAQNF